MLDARVLSLDRVPLWPMALSYIVFWAVTGIFVRTLLRRSLARIAAIHRTYLTEVMAASVPRPAGVAVFLAAMAGGLRFLPFGQPRLAEAHRLLALAVAVLGVVVLMRVAFRSIDAYGRSNPELASSSGVGKAITWVGGLGVCALLVSDALGISLAPALTALGVGSLAVALALQDTLSNFFSGVYLVVDKPVRPGDFIRVDPTYEGYVASIGWRSTHLRTLNDNLVIIPNATLSKAVITNYSLPTPHMATSIRVDVAHDADLDTTEEALADEGRRAIDIPGIADVPVPSVSLSPGFIDGAVGFTVSFYVRSFAEQGKAQHALRKRVAARMKKEGVAMASARALVLKREGS